MKDKILTRKITIKDVANRAHVTPALVSRVFNNDETLLIKDETRKAIVDAIRELDYRPNSIARSLRLKRSRTVGVLIADIMNPFFTEIIKGVQQAANKAGYNIILCNTNDSAEECKRYIEVLSAQMVEGVILGAGYVSDEEIRLLDRTNTKYVLLNRIASEEIAPFVRSNDSEGMRMAVLHLLKLGHTKIAHLSGPLFADTALRRLQGYRKALMEADILYNPDYVMETKYDEESGYRACKKLLRLEDRPTAICAGNDMVAIGAMRAIKEKGLSIPRDISLVGYNDIWVASKLEPPLTTVNTPLLEMGEKAFRLLMKVLKNEENETGSIVIEPHLVVRESTCKVKK